MRQLLLALAALLFAAPALAAPVWFSVETGGHAFKWVDNTYDDGAPKFDRLKWTFDAAFEWAPASLQDRGFLFVAGFRYVSLGESKYSWATYVDGPRVAVKWRGRLAP